MTAARYTPAYDRAVDAIAGEVREELISALATLLEVIIRAPQRNEAALLEVWNMVEALHVRTAELCAHGLSWDAACLFARIALRHRDRDRWLADQLW